MPPDADDQTIAALLAARHPGAMELLYDRWSPLTYTLALRIVRNPTEAEQVVLEAFLTLWRQPELALEHCDDLRAYLCAVVCCDARLRSLKRRPRGADLRRVSIAAQGSRQAAWPPSREEPRGALVSWPEAVADNDESRVGYDR